MAGSSFITLWMLIRAEMTQISSTASGELNTSHHQEQERQFAVLRHPADEQHGADSESVADRSDEDRLKEDHPQQQAVARAHGLGAPK